MYTVAFGKQTTRLPAEVPALILSYCKTYLKLSSAKSMDELCKPMVTKAEEKMRLVPRTEPISPAVACMSAEELASRFPEHHRRLLEDQETERRSPATLVEQEASVLRSVLKETAAKELAVWRQGVERELQARIKSLTSKFEMAIEAVVQNFTRSVRAEFKLQREAAAGHEEL